MIDLKHKKIAVLKGGPGSERDVSLNSAKSVVQALESLGAQVVEIDVKGTNFEIPEDALIAFNVIHGTFGEDGQLQGILEEMGVSYTGAGVETSALAFDKQKSKDVFFEAGVPTPKAEYVDPKSGKISLSLPVVIKPPKEGSSVGVHRVFEESQVEPALFDCSQYGRTALVEEFIQGKELTVGILGDQALPVIHIVPRCGFYDMKNKYPQLYSGGGTDYYCPADLSPEVTERVQAAALAAHRALGVEVYSRVDVLLDEKDQPYVLEVNTIPGMTSSSLLPKAAQALGIEFPELCRRIIELSLEARPNEQDSEGDLDLGDARELRKDETQLGDISFQFGHRPQD